MSKYRIEICYLSGGEWKVEQWDVWDAERVDGKFRIRTPPGAVLDYFSIRGEGYQSAAQLEFAVPPMPAALAGVPGESIRLPFSEGPLQLTRGRSAFDDVVFEDPELLTRTYAWMAANRPHGVFSDDEHYCTARTLAERVLELSAGEVDLELAQQLSRRIVESIERFLAERGIVARHGTEDDDDDETDD